ncbi:hypothetical protein GCM10009682_06000 [Luedemannella flava]|uniref:YcxB-like C-terminal domain-containing protein n=1 Tax=Luedemannella flava TaxID=349316 RepID=A0ABP4XNX7_9ACTN
MEIRVNKPFDPANSLADLRVIYRSSLAGARSFAIAAVAVGSGGAALVLISDRMRLLAIVPLLLAAYGLYVGVGTSRSLRSAVAELPAACQEDAVVTVTDERIVEERPSMRSELAWTAITRVMESDASWLLFYGPRHAYSLPKAGLGPEQEARLRALLAERALVVAR